MCPKQEEEETDELLLLDEEMWVSAGAACPLMFPACLSCPRRPP